MACGGLNEWSGVRPLEQCVPYRKCLSPLVLSPSTFPCFIPDLEKSAIPRFMVFYFSTVLWQGFSLCACVIFLCPNHLEQTQTICDKCRFPGPSPGFWIVASGGGSWEWAFSTAHRWLLHLESSGSPALRVSHILLIKSPGWKMSRKEESQPLN